MTQKNGQGTIWDASLSEEERLDWLIKELTLDEKLNMLSSGSKGVERLGIPDCWLGGEAAHGVEARNDQFGGRGTPTITTSFPQPIGMSASWDQEAIRAAGEVVGREARIIHDNYPWGGISRWAPTVDLLRDPRWGRNEEAYGEDPVQVGTMAAAYVKGIQAKDGGHLQCASTLKHFYANNTEIGRGWKNASISPRNKFELYLEPFRRCIEDGKVEGVMTAYNRINGVLGLFNEDVKYLLKNEFGLSHAVSDGGAMELAASFSHATAMNSETVARSIKAGVDALSGRPDSVYEAAVEALELGLLTEADVDEAIKNSYRTRIRLGIFDEAQDKKDLSELCNEEARTICKNLTDKSLVLLKNDGTLPLKEETLKGVALIGPVGDKWYQDWYGGLSPEHVTLLDGLNQNAKDAGLGSIPFVDGCDRVRLKCGEQYLAEDADGTYHLSDEPDVFVLEDWGEESYTLRNEKTGKYMLTNLAEDPIEGATGDDEDVAGKRDIVTPARLTGKVCAGKDQIFSWFDLEVFRMNKLPRAKEGEEKLLLKDRFGNPLFADGEGKIVTAVNSHGVLTPLHFTLETVINGIEEAVAAASKAGTVILALGHHPMVNAKEEVDRATIAFNPYQQKLFDEIIKVNGSVCVALMSDYPFAICEIQEKARAILMSSTGSQCMGQSLADALLGKVSPAGRLTQTWYASDADLPDIDDYDIIGKGRTYQYFSGRTLYPFGFGKTYASFQYDDLQVSVIGEAKKEPKDQSDAKLQKWFGQPKDVYAKLRDDERVLQVEFSVTNTGVYASDEVVQIYASTRTGQSKKPKKRLIGFDRVREIAPGETRLVKLLIPIRELAFYDVVREALVVEEGNYEITAAPSSEDPGATTTIRVEGEKPLLRELSKRTKADHYDEAWNHQIVEGTYGHSALMAEGPNAYEPKMDGRFSASYVNCIIPENAQFLRIHGIAHEESSVKLFVDGVAVGEITLNTRDYNKYASPARNHMPRAQEDELKRKQSFPLLWADVHVPLDFAKLEGVSWESGHELRVEVRGPFKYDWFQLK